MAAALPFGTELEAYTVEGKGSGGTTQEEMEVGFVCVCLRVPPL